MRYKAALRLTAAAITALMLCSCGAQQQEEVTIDPNALPTSREITAYRSGHKDAEYQDYSRRIVEIISDMGDSGMYAQLEEAFEGWLSGRKELTGGDISFYNTNKVNYACGQKWFRQIGVKAEIYYDAGSIKDEAAFVSDTFDSLCGSLKSGAVGFFKLGEVDMQCFETGSELPRNERKVDDVPDAGDFSQFYDDIAWQPAGEKEALAMAYQAACELGKEYIGEGRKLSSGIVIPEVALTRFGANKDKTRVKMTMEWSSVPENIEFEKVVQASASELYNKMISDAAVKQYILDNGGQVCIEHTDGEEVYSFIFEDEEVRPEQEIFGVAYPDADKYTAGGFSYNAADLSALEINWRFGQVELVESASDTLRVSESGQLDDEMAVHWMMDNGTLRIQFGASNGRVDTDDDNKYLTVEIPKGIDIRINTASADVEADTLEQKSIEVKSASGDVDLENVMAERMEVTTASGDIDIDIAGSTKAEIRSAAGSVDLKLPPEGASVKYTNASGREFETRLEYREDKGRYIFGNGESQVSVELAGGTLEIE